MRQRDRNKRRRVERQEQAVERQARYGNLTLAQRLNLATQRGGYHELEVLRRQIEEAEYVGGVRLA